MTQVDIQAIVRIVTDRFVDRMASQDMADADFEENAGILFNFNNIAATLLKDEPGLEMPGATQTIPIDEALTDAILNMFSEGICFAMNKCAEMGVIGDPKKTVLQDMALEVYNQAKQIVACTYGQESTPSFQFSMDQQVAMVSQAAEGHLMFFIGEYEKKFGPIPLAPLPNEDGLNAYGQPIEQHIQPEQQPVAAAPPPPPAAPAGPQLSPASMEDREKYAAIALLLNAVSQTQRDRIYKSTPPQGRDWVGYYSDAQRIQQELNVSRVQARLAQFRDQLKGSGNRNQGEDEQAQVKRSPISRLAERYDEHKLLSWVRDERSGIVDIIRGHYAEQSVPVQHWRQNAPSIKSPLASTPEAKSLPPRIEELLARYLARRLDSASGHALGQNSQSERHPNAY